LEEEKRFLPQAYSEAILKPPIRRIPDSCGKAPEVRDHALWIQYHGSGGKNSSDPPQNWRIKMLKNY